MNGKCCWWARSAHQQYFLYKSFKLPKTSSSHKHSLCNVRRLKLGHFYSFDMLFSFLPSVLYLDRFWWLTRSHDRVMQRAISVDRLLAMLLGLRYRHVVCSHINLFLVNFCFKCIVLSVENQYLYYGCICYLNSLTGNFDFLLQKDPSQTSTSSKY